MWVATIDLNNKSFLYNSVLLVCTLLWFFLAFNLRKNWEIETVLFKVISFIQDFDILGLRWGWRELDAFSRIKVICISVLKIKQNETAKKKKKTLPISMPTTKKQKKQIKKKKENY